jgi:hypothetical protein
MLKIGLALLLAWLLLGATLILFNHKAALAQAGVAAGSDNAGLVDPLAVGDQVDRIQCLAGYTPTVYAQGLAGPDGLAFGPDGLYVAEETAGRVRRIGSGGSLTTVMTGLANPEGLAFDDQDNLYVVEDIKGGRVVKRSSSGLTTTLVSGLDNPEGITWFPTGNPAGRLYVTESNVEYALSISSFNSSDYRTHVTQISPAGVVTRIFTKTAQLPSPTFPPPDPVEGTFWSYTGDIVKGPDGLLYFSNELSGQEISGTTQVEVIPGFPVNVNYHFISTESIFTIDPAAGTPRRLKPYGRWRFSVVCG